MMATRLDTDQTPQSTPTKRAQAGGMKSVVKNRIQKAFLFLPLVVLTLWTVVPFLVTLSVSLKTRGEVFGDPRLIPRNPTFAAYAEQLARPEFRSAFMNSVWVGLGTTILTLIIAVPAAYAFARWNFRGRHLLLLFTLIPRLVPSIGMLVPLYRLAVQLGMLDKRTTLIIVYTGMLLPLAIWLLVGFFQQVPRELEEAANVDGASLWQRMRYIVVPIAVPALITIGVLAFREAWNEFTLVLVLTSSPGKRTLPNELYLMQGIEGIANFPGEAAFALLTVIPFILIYTRIEKYVVSGVTTGAVK